MNYDIKFIKNKIKKGTSFIHFTLVVQGEWVLTQTPEGHGMQIGRQVRTQ